MTLATTDAFVRKLDTLLVAGQFEKVRSALEGLDVGQCPPDMLTGVLSLTWHAKALLEPERSVFFERAMTALEREWGLPPDRVAKVAERLR